MKISVAQLGARMHYAVPRIFYQAGQLDTLFTDICVSKGWPKLTNLTPAFLRSSSIKRLLGRKPDGIPPDRIIAFNLLGIQYSSCLHRASTTSEITYSQLWAADRFSELILRHGLKESDSVYGFNIGCVKLYRGAKKLEKKIIMEQFIAPRPIEHRLLETEYSISAEWGKLEKDNFISEIIAREQESWSLADIILCGSDFVRQGIIAEGGPAEKCLVVQYGVDLPAFKNHNQYSRKIGGPLKVLFVGSVGPRKGIRYLLDAMRKLEGKPITCRIVGNSQVPLAVLKSFAPSNVEFVGPLPRSEVVREYSTADVFCLPSLCEGSATVIYEALAAGLPIITTPNSGSIVRNGVEGFIVPIQDSEALANSLEKLMSDDILCDHMSIAARERSKLGSLEAYSQRLLQAVNSLDI